MGTAYRGRNGAVPTGSGLGVRSCRFPGRLQKGVEGLARVLNRMPCSRNDYTFSPHPFSQDITDGVEHGTVAAGDDHYGKSRGCEFVHGSRDLPRGRSCVQGDRSVVQAIWHGIRDLGDLNRVVPGKHQELA